MGSSEHNVRAVHLNKFSAYVDEIKVLAFKTPCFEIYPFKQGNVATAFMASLCARVYFTRNDGI